MKRRSDPRHKNRIQIVKILFEKAFGSQLKTKDQFSVNAIIAKKNKIDELINKYAPTWPINQISPIDLAILRLSIWELLFKKPKEPYKVVVDEAVEIAKEYGTDTSASFINGVLGSIIKARSMISTKSTRGTKSK